MVVSCLNQALCDHNHDDRLNVHGHFYVMTQYMKGLKTTVLNSVFVHNVVRQFLVKPKCQTIHAYSRIERVIEV